ncbi:hypothetical protein [Flavobacterium crassostreae]|uniref:DUF4836 domain-containing protein n=1 Tax=Flavobacterium crassostreae TaxID=1763534 RepID=A0A1B9E0G6_9FLAO|nr:hypothetical protein [Flavobacterium crassostreae]OCB75421.1 hypothetical protein LPBF_08495 [Flavobacterium crassostreae]
MKNVFIRLMLVVCATMQSQITEKNYDYFVQYNGPELSKKITPKAFFEHPFITNYASKNPDQNLQKYADLILFDKNITMQGSFRDQKPYYLITIPVKSKAQVQAFLLQLHAKDSSQTAAPNIEDFGDYALYHSKEQGQTIAFDDKYMVIYKITKKYSDRAYPATEEVFEKVEELEENYPDTEADSIEITPSSEDTFEDQIQDPYAPEILLAKAQWDSLQIVQQRQDLQAWFKNGFVAPKSSKINASAAIATWIDYNAALTSLGSFYSLSKIMSNNNLFSKESAMLRMVKGVQVDFYLENDHARVEEIIEYAPEMAKIMRKITNRKNNKNSYRYFPNTQPLASMNYSINTKEALANLPKITSDLFKETPQWGQEVALVTDLISTIVDEKATATLFDGDLNLFLYNFENREITTTSYQYDANYEEIETQKTSTKSIPLFAAIFTSTHPSFGDKLLQLGVRKNLLEEQDGYYEIRNTEKMGDLFLIKDHDVVVIANTMEYFSGSKKSSYTKGLKKELRKYYFQGKIDFITLAKQYAEATNLQTNTKEINLFTENFKDIRLYSSRKMPHNKLRFTAKINTNSTDKNVLLQVLDVLEKL